MIVKSITSFYKVSVHISSASVCERYYSLLNAGGFFRGGLSPILMSVLLKINPYSVLLPLYILYKEPKYFSMLNVIVFVLV